MITHSFYVKPERLEECKSFIRTLPSARFVNNPIFEINKYFIKITTNCEDGNKLNILFNKWFNEDHPQKPIKENLFKRIWKFIKL